MTAFRMDSASHIETTESWASGHGPGCGRSTGAMHLADGDPRGPTGAVPGWVRWRLPTRSRWGRTWAAGPRGRTRPRWPGRYARTHDRGAVIVAAGARHPGDAQRTARAWLRHRPAHRARRRAGPDLAHPRPVVYRSLSRLLDAGLITRAAVESGRAPQRTIYTVTAPRRRAAARWLDTPVD